MQFVVSCGERHFAMEHIAAVLLIIGCSDGLIQCRELPAPTSIYEAKEDCDRELPYSLGAFTGQVEQLYAQCIPVDPAVEEDDAELFWEVHPDGTLVASVHAPVMVVSNSQRTAEGPGSN
jgi:hypothetical protein